MTGVALVREMQELDVVSCELPVFPLVPQLLEPEIAEDFFTRIFLGRASGGGQKDFPSSLELRWTRRNIDEPHLGKRFEQTSIGQQMGLETVQDAKPGVDVREGNHRGREGTGTEEHGELVHEVALGRSVVNGSGVALPGQEFFRDVQLLAEVVQFVVLGFEIFVLQMRQDEVQGNEPRANVFEGMGTAVAKVFSADGAVHDAGEKVVHK